MKSLAVLLILVPLSGLSQKRELPPGTYYWENPTIPLKDGKIYYSGVVDIDAGDNELFQRALRWASLDQHEPWNLILYQDPATGEIVFQRSFKYITGKGGAISAHENQVIKYTGKLQFKDSRYRYEITDFKDFNSSTDILEFLDVYQVGDRKRQQLESQVKSQIIQAVEGYQQSGAVEPGIIDQLQAGMSESLTQNEDW